MIGNYDGGKGQVFRHIINEMPPHRVYVEPFVGGGSVALNKKPAKLNILVDMDNDVVEAWIRHLVNSGGAAGEVGTSPHPVMSPALSSLSTMAAEPVSIATPDDVTWLVLCGDALEILPALSLGRDALVYADPPYLFDVRSRERPLYKYEMGNPVEHQAMLQLLRSLRCKVMLSGYWSELYDRYLADWRSFSFQARDRGGNCKNEFIWCNFAEPQRLHDYQWLGDDFRERERIKRKASRWVARLADLDLLERRAILSRLDEHGLLD